MRLKKFGLATILVFFSLVSALAIRFLWIRAQFDVGPPLAQYKDFVATAAHALTQSLIPAFAWGLAIFWLARRPFGRQGPAAQFSRDLLFLSAFFLGMTGYGLAGGPTFAPATWLIAWGVAAVARALSELTGRLDSDVTQRVIYSRPTQLMIDGGVVAGAFLVAYLIRFDGGLPPLARTQFLHLVTYVVLLQIGLHYLWGVYSFIWRFTGLREALVIAQSVASGALLTVALRILLVQFEWLQVPFGVLLIQPVLAYVGMLGFRVLRRMQYRRQRKRPATVSDERARRILLVGAGRAGQLLARELEQVRSFQLVGFVDDDPRKRKKVINGLRVLGPTSQVAELAEALGVTEVTLCMPSAANKVVRGIVTVCEENGLRVTSVPSLSEIILGKVSISRLRPIKMEDLLGRASIEYAKDDWDLVANYQGARILVTGAAGSIGSELVRQLTGFLPSALILLDKDENGLYEIGLETKEVFPEAVEVVADIRDTGRLRRVFEQHRPEIVFHAAAYKHVPLMELNPCEAILNNVVGSRNLVDLSDEFGVKSFVLVSTDKAVNPTNVMGASKRVAETVLQRKASQGNSATRLCCVRFGNVLGSRASVVPLFQKQIREGRNITVTHPDVQRYFMTIPEAAQLVIQAGSLGCKGEIFLLDMGDPVKIVDLARDLIEQSGLVLGRDIAIEFTGLRPGEKMFEELLISSEQGVRDTRYPKIFVAAAAARDWPGLQSHLNRLEKAARDGDDDALYATLEELDIGYSRRPQTDREVPSPVV